MTVYPTTTRTPLLSSTSHFTVVSIIDSDGAMSTPTTTIASSALTTVMNSSANQDMSKKSKSATLSNGLSAFMLL